MENLLELLRIDNLDVESLKEYIKSLVRQQLEEESTTAGVPGYMTPAAFAPKGQKKNKATKYAEKQGMKVAKGMPKHSKMLDYKELWPGKKSAMNENEELQIGDKVEYEKQKWQVMNKTDKEVRLQALNKEGEPTGVTTWILSAKPKRIEEETDEIECVACRVETDERDQE